MFAFTGTDADFSSQLVMMDMGQHAIQDLPEPKQLYQVLVPGLEDRARICPEIITFEQITTGASTSSALSMHLLMSPHNFVKPAASFLTQACMRKQDCRHSGVLALA